MTAIIHDGTANMPLHIYTTPTSDKVDQHHNST